MDDRYTCTKDAPWTPDKGRAVHPDAKGDGECSDGCCDYYKCPHCGLRFRCEVPDARRGQKVGGGMSSVRDEIETALLFRAARCDCHERGFTCLRSLTDWQIEQLAAIRDADRAFLLLPEPYVGLGRSVVELLAPMIVSDCERALIITHPALCYQYQVTHERLAQHFRVPSFVDERICRILGGRPLAHIITRAKISSRQGADLLTAFSPQLIIINQLPRSRHTTLEYRLTDYATRAGARFLGWLPAQQKTLANSPEKG